ncbi:hypothetical protein [Arthrobacter sp. SX1312]|uniref:hypothetical protein n=1 Tax=Arthrobacter sp. SX1312 TaxID=2058896 RepID=UPI0011B0DF3F|nr:hypothetical protein [Arthrobacter sp. SX1312]
MGNSLLGARPVVGIFSIITTVLLLFGVVFVFASSRGHSSPEAAAVSSATSSEQDEETEPSPAPAPSSQVATREPATPRRVPTLIPSPTPSLSERPPVDEVPVEQPAANTSPPVVTAPLPQTTEQPVATAQPVEVDEEPEVVCPSGHLTVSLDEMSLGSASNSLGLRDVIISGTVRNDATAAIDVGLTSEITVVGIDAAGEVSKTYSPDFDYTPPPGTIRPLSVPLPPGQSMHFQYNDDDLHTDWTTIKYWTLDPQYTLTYPSFTDPHYTCESFAAVEIMSDPIPNRP